MWSIWHKHIWTIMLLENKCLQLAQSILKSECVNRGLGFVSHQRPTGGTWKTVTGRQHLTPKGWNRYRIWKMLRTLMTWRCAWRRSRCVQAKRKRHGKKTSLHSCFYDIAGVEKEEQVVRQREKRGEGQGGQVWWVEYQGRERWNCKREG